MTPDKDDAEPSLPNDSRGLGREDGERHTDRAPSEPEGGQHESRPSRDDRKWLWSGVIPLVVALVAAFGASLLFAFLDPARDDVPKNTTAVEANRDAIEAVGQEVSALGTATRAMTYGPAARFLAVAFPDDQQIGGLIDVIEAAKDALNEGNAVEANKKLNEARPTLKDLCDRFFEDPAGYGDALSEEGATELTALCASVEHIPSSGRVDFSA